ncbi:Protein NETWORKED 2D [Bienertia sinuspersici]
MAEAAIKSCNDTITQLEEKQERAAEDAKAESQKIKDARDKLKSLKGEFHGEQAGASEDRIRLDDEEAGGEEKSEGLELIRDKIKEHFDVGETTSLTVLEMADKIDELVNKVINLESSMSSQTALIHSLRSETDELQSQVKSLEDDKANLIAGKTTLSDKLGEMEDKLRGLQDLNESLESQNISLETHYNEARSNLDNISQKLNDVKPEVEVEKPSEFQESKGSTANMNVKNETVQGKQVSDIITSGITQDGGEKLGESDRIKSKVEPPNPSMIDDIQAQESKPSTIDNNQPQESKPSTIDNNQPQESKPGTIINNQPQESKPSIIDGNQPQETSNKKEEEVINPQAIHIQQPATQASSPQKVEPREPITNSIDEPNAFLSVPQPEERRKEEEPDWKQLFTEGLEGKEKVLLAEYTATLRNYKETKKKLCEVEMKNEENFSEIEKQLRELKSSLVMKDEEIHSLRQKLSAVQKKLDEYKNAKEKEEELADRDEPSSPPEDDDEIKFMAPDEEHEISPVEQKLRAEMDQILEENLDFWMRFSASFAQVQKFQNGVHDLQAELAKLEKNSDKKEGSSHGDAHVNLSLKSDARPIYKHLREIETELTVWLEQSEKLKEELQRRFSQLCHIQEEIKHALSAGAEDDDMKFTSFQAAKFQGEVANMQQENNKVADELQAGMDYITSLQLEVERTITRLNEELGFSSSRSQNENEKSGNRARVPLRSFIFGVKPQKKKQSIFSCMHPGMMNRRYHHLKADKSP